MIDLLFDTPWWLPTLLAGARVVLFWHGNRSQETKRRNAGLLCLLLAAVVCTLSYLVDTDVEKAQKKSKQLAHAVDQRDWTTVKNILAPQTALSMSSARTVYANRDEILYGAKAAVERYGVKNLRILSSTAEKTDTVITVTMTIYTEHEALMGRPITTTWQFDWQQTGKNWDLERITCIKIGNTTGEEAQRQFPTAPRP